MAVAQNSARVVQNFRNIPGPVSLPVVGTAYLYKLGIFNVLKYPEVLQHLYNTYGPIVRENIGSTTYVRVFEPDDARTIYQNEDKMPYVVPLQETAQLYRKNADMSLGLGNTNGEEWYRLRAAVRHLMLKPKDVQHFLPAVHGVAKDLVKRYQQRSGKDGVVPDLATDIAKWSHESAGVVCFDKRLGYLWGGPEEAVAEEVIQANKTMFHLSGILKFALPVYKYIKTPKWRRIVKAEDVVVRITEKCTEEALTAVEKLIKENRLSKDQYSFILTLMSKELSRKDISVITQSLCIDSLSTTVPMVMHNLYCLATNPEVQAKAYEEVKSVLGTSEEVTTSHLGQLNYVKAVVKETFRMYPNGTEISRINQNDLVLSNYHIPAKTKLTINMGVHFRSEKYFSSPQEYRPERWLRGEETENVHPYILTPFGFGTRTCVGRRFAEQDMYVVLAEILRHFHLRYEGTRPMELEYNTLLMPAGPLPIRFIPRTL